MLFSLKVIVFLCASMFFPWCTSAPLSQ
uniref:Uncharacterized protein n=1 Tax=Arundo donax TaxID=35708 RepID=A0A0A9BQU0_ARUDO